MSKTPTKTVTYSGGSDGVVMYLSCGAVEFLNGVPVEVSAEDAKSLAGHPDFQPAAKASPTTQPSEEDA